MAEHPKSLPGKETEEEDNFYQMLEEYTKQVRLRYELPVRLNLPRAYPSGKSTSKIRLGYK